MTKWLLAVFFKAGRVVQIATHVVSEDGKALTITTQRVNVKGEHINNVDVLDKQ